MSNQINVSVIIPSYNCGVLLPSALDSVIGQTYPPSEIIVVDDGSTDGTEGIIHSYANKDRIRYIKKDNGGVASARNVGLQMSRYEWIAFLDADDLWLPDRLEKGIAIIRKVPHLKWVSGAFLEERIKGERIRRELSVYGRDFLLDGCWFRNFFDVFEKHTLFHTSTMLIHRSCFDDAGMFNEMMKRREDLDLWVRIAFQNPEIGYSLEPLSIYRRREDSLIGTVAGMSRLEMLTWFQHLSWQSKTTEERWLPYARYHAYGAFKIWLHNGDRESLRYLLDELPHWLPKVPRTIGYILTQLPAFIMSSLSFILRMRLRVLGKPGEPESFRKAAHGITRTKEKR